MYLVFTTRESMVSFLAPGATGAEIGVAYGDFSDVLLSNTSPNMLHLIDPWSHLEPAPSGADRLFAEFDSRIAEGKPSDPPPYNLAGDGIYSGVCKRFDGHPAVRLHRQYSYKAVSEFKDEYFDYVYIDGNHEYEYVLRDLNDYAPKVKRDGLIMGHDFFDNAFARENNYGIMPAVGEFLRASGWRFLALTQEPFSSFVLIRESTGFAGEFLERLCSSNIPMVEIPDRLAFNYHDTDYKTRNGQLHRIPSFSDAEE